MTNTQFARAPGSTRGEARIDQSASRLQVPRCRQSRGLGLMRLVMPGGLKASIFHSLDPSTASDGGGIESFMLMCKTCTVHAALSFPLNGTGWLLFHTFLTSLGTLCAVMCKPRDWILRHGQAAAYVSTHCAGY